MRLACHFGEGHSSKTLTKKIESLCEPLEPSLWTFAWLGVLPYSLPETTTRLSQIYSRRHVHTQLIHAPYSPDFLDS